MKTCTKCKKDKPLDQFRKNRKAKDGLHSQCKECHSQYGKNCCKEIVFVGQKECHLCGQIKPRSSFHKGTDKGTGLHHWCKPCRREKGFKYRYKLTVEQYDTLCVEQNNCCFICLKSFDETSPNVDHCHNSGTVRGLLCGNCNKALGLFNDDPNVTHRAAEYLSHSQLIEV